MSAVRPPDRVEAEIHAIRAGLTVIVDELDVRRRELLDWRRKLRKNAIPIALVGGVLAGLGYMKKKSSRGHRRRDGDRRGGRGIGRALLGRAARTMAVLAAKQLVGWNARNRD